MQIEDSIDVEQYIPAIVKAAGICFMKLPYDSSIEVEDLIHDGLIHVYEYVLPKWDSKKSRFLTHLTTAMWQFYSNKLVVAYNRRDKFAEWSKERSPQVDPFSPILALEVLNSVSDAAKEMISLLLEPPKSLVMKMEFAKDTKGSQAIVFREYLERRGFNWEKLAREVKIAIQLRMSGEVTSII